MLAVVECMVQLAVSVEGSTLQEEPPTLMLQPSKRGMELEPHAHMQVRQELGGPTVGARLRGPSKAGREPQQIDPSSTIKFVRRGNTRMPVPM
jgi:hypothetical protein